MHGLSLGKSIIALTLFAMVGCSYPHVYCAPDDCGPCNPQLNASCTDCGGTSCEVPCGKPARGLFTHLKYLASCGGGCGEFYIHPWINERPDECDPCNDHGDWIGPQACCDRGIFGNTCPVSNCPSCSTQTACGCDSCSGGSAPGYTGPYVNETYVEEPGTIIYENQDGMPTEGNLEQSVPESQPSLGPAARAPATQPTPALGTGVRQR